MSDEVPASLRTLVEERARQRCEYCLLHADDAVFSHEIDHIVSRKHRGQTVPENLALACFVCNRAKGSDIASIDLETARIIRLFDPRRDNWADHFRAVNGRIEPLTAEGRVTEYLLRFNLPRLVEMRRSLQQAGRLSGE